MNQPPMLTEDDENDKKVPLTEIFLVYGATFDEYAAIDDNVATCDEQTATTEEIAASGNLSKLVVFMMKIKKINKA